MTVRVVIVDDHNLVREGIARLIDSEPDLMVVGEASSLTGGQALVAEVGADVLVVDVSMPDGSGLSLARSARSAHPGLGIVVLTMHNDDDTLLEALDAGASALVLKSSSADDVLEAIRRTATAPDSFTATGLAGALRRRSTLAAARPILTPRETEVLMRLVDGDSVALVARQLFMSESTVKTHVGKVYEKLGAHNRATAIMAAVRLGFVKAHVGSGGTGPVVAPEQPPLPAQRHGAGDDLRDRTHLVAAPQFAAVMADRSAGPGARPESGQHAPPVAHRLPTRAVAGERPAATPSASSRRRASK